MLQELAEHVHRFGAIIPLPILILSLPSISKRKEDATKGAPPARLRHQGRCWGCGCRRLLLGALVEGLLLLVLPSGLLVQLWLLLLLLLLGQRMHHSWLLLLLLLMMLLPLLLCMLACLLLLILPLGLRG